MTSSTLDVDSPRALSEFDDRQRLSALLRLMATPSQGLLTVAARHPWPWLLRLTDIAFARLTAPFAGETTGREITIAGGGASLAARLYERRGGSDPTPLLVYFHGGGWVLGGLDSHHNVCRFIAGHAGCKVLAVAYRKAPEHRFPAAVDDCLAGYRWAVEHAAELGADVDRIGVGGDSAGGNLAAAVALDCADDGTWPRPCLAWLIYPLLDADVDAFTSTHTFARGPMLTRQNLRDLIHQYAPRPQQQLDPRLSVARSPRLASMPPTYIATAGMDPLRDQGEQFAAALRGLDVPVEAQRFPNLPHGFQTLLVDKTARRATEDTCRALRRAFAEHFGIDDPASSTRTSEKQQPISARHLIGEPDLGIPVDRA